MNFTFRFKIFCLAIIALLIFTVDATAQKIPDCLFNYELGPEQHIFIVEKISQTLYIYSNYKESPVATFKITTGKNGGPKISEGDLKTPEGIYFFTDILSSDRLPKVEDYGEKAFVLNYPNPLDKHQNKNGSGIWLHGAFDAAKIKTPFNTRGCVVLSNNDLIEVSKYIYLNKTPMCIYEKIHFDTIDNIKKKRDKIIEMLKDWKTSWENKDIDGYIAYYDPGFTYNRMDLRQFKNVKAGLNEKYKYIRVFLSDIDLYSFNGYFVVLFNQLYLSDKSQFYGKKIQYWKGDEDSGKIADEMSFNLPIPSKFEATRGNFVTIDEFRRDYIKPVKSDLFAITPPDIRIKNISIREQSVQILVSRDNSAKDLKVIPVLTLKNNHTGNTYNYAINGIAIFNGAPKDFSKAINLDKIETRMIIDKEKDTQLKSITLFVINNHFSIEQIITHFIN